MIDHDTEGFKIRIEIFTGFFNRFKKVIQPSQGVWRRRDGDKDVIGRV